MNVSSHSFTSGCMPYQPKQALPQPLGAVVQARGGIMVIMDGIGTTVRPLSRVLVLPLAPPALLEVLPAPLALPLAPPALLEVLPAPLALPSLALPLALPSLALLWVLPAPLALPSLALPSLALPSLAPPSSLRPPHPSARCSSHSLLSKLVRGCITATRHSKRLRLCCHCLDWHTKVNGRIM
jgi:hypothetical protein